MFWGYIWLENVKSYGGEEAFPVTAEVIYGLQVIYFKCYEKIMYLHVK